jgi:predicted enzyme related to lactoylglutathione lyase
MNAILEHCNLTVSDLDHAVEFFGKVLPGFKVRHEGVIEDKTEDGGTIRTRWVHIGGDDSYLALQATPDGMPFQRNKYTYFNHMGFVVGDIEQVLADVAAMGYSQVRKDYTHPHRKRAYVWVFDGNVLEFVEYHSENPGERNAY